MDIIQPTVVKTPYLFVYWLSFMFITTFGMLNIIVGLFCENAVKEGIAFEKNRALAMDEKRNKMLKELMQVFRKMDSDSSGYLTREEYMEAITKDKVVMDFFEKLELEGEDDLFDRIDGEGIGRVTFDQFFMGMTLIMKGKDKAQAKDLMPTYLAVQAANRRESHVEESLSEFSTATQENMKKLKDSISLLEAATNTSHQPSCEVTPSQDQTTIEDSASGHPRLPPSHEGPDIISRVKKLEDSSEHQESQLKALSQKMDLLFGDLSFIAKEMKRAKEKRDRRGPDGEGPEKSFPKIVDLN